MADIKLINVLSPISQDKNKLIFDKIKGDWVTNIWYEKILLSICLVWTFVSGCYMLYRWLF